MDFTPATRSATSPFYSSAVLSGGRVFVGGRDKLMHALDASTGKEVWSCQTGVRIDSSPAVVSGRVYVGSSDGKLYVFDAATGAVVQQFEAGGALSASPAGASGRLVTDRRTASCSAWADAGRSPLIGFDAQRKVSNLQRSRH